MTRIMTLGLNALLVVSSTLAMPAAKADDAAARFKVSGEIRPQARSDDGRFALDGDLKTTLEQSSNDGRFVVKAVNVPEAGCDPLLDLFANGFEGS